MLEKCLVCVSGTLFNVVAVVPQVFDNTPAALEGTLAAGDEITGVNGKPVKGKTKVEVAKMIQAVQVHRCWEWHYSPQSLTVLNNPCNALMANCLPLPRSVDTHSLD